MAQPLFLGIDVGTSAVRGCALGAAGKVAGMTAAPLPAPRQQGAAIDQEPAIWWEAVTRMLRELGRSLDLGAVARIAVDGTSGTLLLTDETGAPLSTGLMYNDARAAGEAARIKALAPPESGAHGASSALAKLLHLLREGGDARVRHAIHQADWIAGRLAGRFGWSDENNALKLGYDPVTRRWPDWIDRLEVPRHLLPDVLVPGALVGRIDPAMAGTLGLSPAVEIRAGTTDGVAAFIATRASEVGDAVTSLGTTLVVKLLSERPIFAPAQGVYSHRLGDRWLAGGASNSGGTALLAHFTAGQMEALTARIDPARPTGLDYYPLPKPGERFPIADAALPPRVTPRPSDDAVFFQGLLEGIAAIEALAYRRLEELDAPSLKRVISVGGGAKNEAWTKIRRRVLGVPVETAETTEAGFGAALLALRGGPA
ncbi:MAG TPA: FGGY-family carbohydrate kinase [Hypericibacter adhaerens]|uniref:FGGY-family carbohydrate kinase n=1 Tax=Hypericibacter adhaerens TaxID=2602016 RepID=UPI002C96F814|nr:FGGY-family carbohydrate kinase [Hypericibacter adhaerens]HWA44170.1 FGGY-family carbohydrate kinase [Hypericibacter adhaerens]